MKLIYWRGVYCRVGRIVLNRMLMYIGIGIPGGWVVSGWWWWWWWWWDIRTRGWGVRRRRERMSVRIRSRVIMVQALMISLWVREGLLLVLPVLIHDCHSGCWSWSYQLSTAVVSAGQDNRGCACIYYVVGKARRVLLDTYCMI